MSVRDLACKELVEIITDYLEGTLPPEDVDRFEGHLAECDGCTQYVQQMRRTIEFTGRLTEDAIPEPARDRLLEALRDWRAR